MIIAIDYDGTYTLDPPLWDSFITICEMSGHTVVCVTGRSGLMDQVALTDKNVRVIYSGVDFKSEHCRSLGIKVDVWIDDMPGMIAPASKVEW